MTNVHFGLEGGPFENRDGVGPCAVTDGMWPQYGNACRDGRIASPHFSHALRRLHHRKRFHCLIKLTWRMASNLPDFERTFPPPPVGEVGGEVCGLAVSGSWGSGAGAAQQGMRQGKLMLIRAGRGDSDMDPAHADLYQSADLQQFQPDAAATGPGELGEGQADAA